MRSRDGNATEDHRARATQQPQAPCSLVCSTSGGRSSHLHSSVPCCAHRHRCLSRRAAKHHGAGKVVAAAGPRVVGNKRVHRPHQSRRVITAEPRVLEKGCHRGAKSAQERWAAIAGPREWLAPSANGMKLEDGKQSRRRASLSSISGFNAPSRQEQEGTRGEWEEVEEAAERDVQCCPALLADANAMLASP